MDNQDIQRLRDLPIESVAERLGLTVTRHKTLCPFHPDRHPSLSFHRGRNTYRCFVCGAHGGTIDLTMQYNHMSFLDACHWLSGGDLETRQFGNSENRKDSEVPKLRSSEIPTRYGRFFEHPFISNEAAHFLYDERHLDPRVIRWCRLNSYTDRHGIHWLQIPYYDIDGHLIGVQCRHLGNSENRKFGNSENSELERTPKFRDSEVPSVPRFKFPYGSRCSIYNLQILRLLRPHEPLYIAEGCSDCWSLLSAGHKAIAIPSATLLNSQSINMLLTFTSQLSTEYHMYPDRDPPGERLFQQLRDVFPSIIQHTLPTDCKDFSDYYMKPFNPLTL